MGGHAGALMSVEYVKHDLGKRGLARNISLAGVLMTSLVERVSAQGYHPGLDKHSRVSSGDASMPVREPGDERQQRAGAACLVGGLLEGSLQPVQGMRGGGAGPGGSVEVIVLLSSDAGGPGEPEPGHDRPQCGGARAGAAKQTRVAIGAAERIKLEGGAVQFTAAGPGGILVERDANDLAGRGLVVFEAQLT